jgi:surfeit locus 1 family protein
MGYLGLLVAVVAGFGWLGVWQLDTARGDAARTAIDEARSQAATDITALTAPHARFGAGMSARPVTASGRYAPQGQVLVPNRLLDGRSGYWVISPFVVERTGATLPVLRGFVEEAADASTPPAGQLTLLGGLAPGESPSATTVPEGQIGSVDLSVLVNTWPGDLYNAFVFLDAETPATGRQLTKVPTPRPDAGLDWRNAGYAIQWWVFAAFAVWMYLRMLRQESNRGGSPGIASGSGGPPRGTLTPAGASPGWTVAPAHAPPGGAGENSGREHS